MTLVEFDPNLLNRIKTGRRGQFPALAEFEQVFTNTKVCRSILKVCF